MIGLVLSYQFLKRFIWFIRPHKVGKKLFKTLFIIESIHYPQILLQVEYANGIRSGTFTINNVFQLMKKISHAIGI